MPYFFKKSLGRLFIMHSYGKALYLVRIAKNLSQDDLGNKTGLSKSLISLYESGKRYLNKQKFTIICEKLGLTTSLIDLLISDKFTNENKKLAQELGLVLIQEVEQALNERK